MISGASRGIGKCIALKSLQEGHRLSLGLRNTEIVKGTLLDPKVSGPNKVLINRYDAKETNCSKRWVENTIKQFGCIDTIIHCAFNQNRNELNFVTKQSYSDNIALTQNLLKYHIKDLFIFLLVK